MSETVLVTGGAGFIGSHLIERLLGEGKRVICLDNLSTGREENVKYFLNNKNFSFVKGDIVNGINVSERVDKVFNLASPASPIDYQLIPIETLLAGSIGMKNVLDFCLKNDADLLHASTSEVYGDPLEHPQRETYFGNVNTVGPRSCYDESKRFAEAMIAAYRRIHGVKGRIVRIFNTYGPRMRKHDGRVVPTFINQALHNKPLTVFGDGSQTRSFCFVSDTVDGLCRLMNKPFFEPVNIGNPHEITMKELAEIIIGLCNSNSEVSFKPLPRDDPSRRKPDISRAKEVLGWQPRVDLKQGLMKTIDYFKEFG